jgi:hypothetical protein
MRPDVHRRSIRRRSRDEEDPRYVIGIDFGITRNYTALAILERVDCRANSSTSTQHPNPIVYHVGHLKRFALGTDTPEIINFVSDFMKVKRYAERTGLIVDASGIGAPIVKEMRRYGLYPVPVTITASGRTTLTNIPKRHLMSALRLQFEQGRIRIPASIKLRDTLIEEFNNFTVKFSNNGNPIFSSIAGAHNDLIIALALAVHFFENRRRLPRVHATVIGPTQSTSGRLYLERLAEDRMLNL